MRRVRLLMAAVALAAALNGCRSGGTPGPDSDPPAPTAEPSTSGASTSPSADPEAWRDAFTSAELAAFDGAFNRWTEYEARSTPVWAAGVATKDAERLFREYFASPAWQIAYDRLKTYQEVEVKVPRPPDVLWSQGRDITVKGSNSTVVLAQCVDLTAQGTTQFGKPVEWPKPFLKPVLREITLDRREDSAWLVTINEPPSPESFERCSEGDQP
jgi:hypothetical protein